MSVLKYKVSESKQSAYFEGISRVVALDESDKSITFDIPTSLQIPQEFEMGLFIDSQNIKYDNSVLFELNGIIFKMEKNKVYISFGGLLMELENNNNLNLKIDSECTCVFKNL